MEHELKIIKETATVREIVEGYHEDEHGNVVGYGGMLNIRPPYQREYLYEGNEIFRKNLLESIYHNRPIGLIYFARANAGDYDYELLDGQQRINTICKFIAENQWEFEMDGHPLRWTGLQDNERGRFLNYELDVHVCESDNDRELMKWFEVINTGAQQLSQQELRNAVYAGSWVTDAKKFFTKPGGGAEFCRPYMKDRVAGELWRPRQGHLERVLQWITGSSEDRVICSYMAEHFQNTYASDLTDYFKEVVNWIEQWFIPKKASMDSLNWGDLYRTHKNFDHEKGSEYTKSRQLELLRDIEVKMKKGIYRYILEGETQEAERHLNLRAFD